MSCARVLRAVLLASLAAAPLSAQKMSADESMIRAARDYSNRAIAKHDTSALASVWLAEYSSVSSTNAQNRGRDAARISFAGLFKDRPDVVYIREPRTITVNKKWGHAGESGKWTGKWTLKEGVTKVGGDYYAKWKKVDGRWMLLTEVFVQTSCSGKSYCAAPPVLR